MTAVEIDLSRVTSARDLHAVFSGALHFPDWYGHNWDAFWDLVSSDYSLPEQLLIRGLDHVERVLPDEATKMLRCFADYNNSPGRACAISVTGDYSAPLFFLQYEVRPTASAARDDVGGAIVNCWIKARSAREANEIAVDRIAKHGWRVISHEEVGLVSLASASAEDEAFVAQACVDGAFFDFHTWPHGEDGEASDET